MRPQDHGEETIDNIEAGQRYVYDGEAPPPYGITQPIQRKTGEVNLAYNVSLHHINPFTAGVALMRPRK